MGSSGTSGGCRKWSSCCCCCCVLMSIWNSKTLWFISPIVKFDQRLPRQILSLQNEKMKNDIWNISAAELSSSSSSAAACASPSKFWNILWRKTRHRMSRHFARAILRTGDVSYMIFVPMLLPFYWTDSVYATKNRWIVTRTVRITWMRWYTTFNPVSIKSNWGKVGRVLLRWYVTGDILKGFHNWFEHDIVSKVYVFANEEWLIFSITMAKIFMLYDLKL